MPNLIARCCEPELMDDPALDRRQHEQALRALARVHRLTGVVGRLWRRIRKQVADERPLTIVDVGCGDGWLLRQLGRLAKRAGGRVKLVGCDFSQQALDIAAGAMRPDDAPFDFHRADVTQDELPIGDVVVCSLLLHHFSNAQVIEILGKLGRSAQKLLLIEDLIRSQMGYAYCWLGVRLVSRSVIVHTDGPISVRAAFSFEEIRELLDRAGLSDAEVRRHWPERLLIRWSPAKGADSWRAR